MDPFIVPNFLLEVVVLLMIPTSAAGFVWLCVAKAKSRPTSEPIKLVAVSIAIICIGSCAAAAGRRINDQAVESAKSYPAQIKPLLEDYRHINGSYPGNLDQLPSNPPVPRLPRTSYGYTSDGQSYEFSFGQPDVMFGTWRYDSKSESWEYET